MKLSSVLSAVCALVLFASAPAFATVHLFLANLDGLQESTPNASPGSGSASMTLDDVTGDIIVNGVFVSLVSSATAAHVHGPADPGFDAGVLVTLTADAATSGSVTGGGTLSPANILEALDDRLYINIHTSAFPGGEIRGQFLLVPEPSAIALLGLAGVALIRRRR